MAKTTVVATLGPATSSPEMIEELVRRRVTVFRLNFSHGTPASHEAALESVRRAARNVPWAVCVMGDLCGPKIRAAAVEPEGRVAAGDEVVIRADGEPGTPRCFGITAPETVQDILPGHRILIDDGAVRLRAVGRDGARLLCRVETGGVIATGKGINLPDTAVSLPAITNHDWAYVDWAVAHDLDYLALSFVQTDAEVLELKAALARKNSGIRVVVKIEKPRALENIDSILRAADALLVARGDLGVEMDLAEVPAAQKRITALCRKVGKPVIVATQVLQSMIQNSSPTRAEASDTVNAVMDYADAIMLSGETAVGAWPLRAVEFLVHACKVTEQYLEQSELHRPVIETTRPALHDREALARSVAVMLDRVSVRLIAVGTDSGETAGFLSKARADAPVLALCPDEHVARRLALYYGVISVHAPLPADFAAWLRQVETLCLENGWACPGESILLLPPVKLLAPQIRWSLMMHSVAGPAARCP